MNKIGYYRKLARLTQAQASKAAGWSYQSRWSGYERGDRTPTVHDAQIIVRVLTERVLAETGTSCTLDDVFPPDAQEAPAPASEESKVA